MTSAGSPDDEAPAGDETRAFQRFYLEGTDGKQAAAAPRRGPLYRLLIGWWRKG